MVAPRRALSFVVLSALLASGCGEATSSGSSAIAPNHSATFQTTSCPFKVKGGAFPSSHIRCGYLVVPENRQSDSGKTIRVAVAIFKATQPHPAPDPLVYLIGGPGGTIIASWGSSIVANGLNLYYFGNRDLVLVDQRGTGLSKPQLACPEVDRAGWQGLDRHLSEAASNGLIYTALRACRTRLVKAGIDLTAYNNVENAADIADLRTALGYKQINLQGGSYGSTLALQVMRDHPQGIRSVVLEAIADPQFNVYNDFLASTWNSLQRVFRECAASKTCNKAHPHLRQTFIRGVARLQAHPMVWNVYSTTRHRSYPARYDGAAIINGLHAALATYQRIHLVPEMIDEVAAGHGPILDQAKKEAGWSTDPGRMGMFLSMECSQDQSRASAATIAASTRGVPAAIRSSFTRSLRYMAALDDLTAHASPLKECSIWHVPSNANRNVTYFHSDIPTLLLVGAFDPNTRPERMPALAAHLGHAYLVTFPTYGHGAVTAGPCSDGITLSFLTTPNQKPNTRCVAQMKMQW
jgi:pimeloyl-ACP methyl ester carboxylesterase